MNDLRALYSDRTLQIISFLILILCIIALNTIIDYGRIT